MSKRLALFLFPFVLFGTWIHAERVSREITYVVEGVEHRGVLSYDDALKTKRPAVLVVHEWWGMNAYARQRAEQLADLGYVAFALDMYGEGKTAEHPSDAGAFAAAAMRDLDLAEKKFRAAMGVLREQPQVDPLRMGALGYCFGGGVALQMARRGVPLDAVVSVHGSVATTAPAEKNSVKAKILVCHGAADVLVAPEDLRALKLEMDNAGAELTVIEYPDAKHSFSNPDADRVAKEYNLPLGYNAEADAKSWLDMKAFFERIWK